ncbi:hypothetical protein ACI3PL_32030, partial [Lacticaseibacillus paracasei]
INAASGFISLSSANSIFFEGDKIQYTTYFGNTEINGLKSGDYYNVYFANSSGMFLSYIYNSRIKINSNTVPGFANNV